MAKNDKTGEEEVVEAPEAEEEETPEAPEIDVDEETEDEEEAEVPAIPVPVAEDDPTADAVAAAHRSQLRVIRTRLQSEIEDIDAQLN